MTNEEAMGILYSHSRINPKIGCEQKFIAYQNGDVEKALDIAIKAIGQTTWIPVSKRLPNEEEYRKNNGMFNVTDGNRSYAEWFDAYDKKGFGEPTMYGFRIDKCVIAWMPLPESYQGE